ncbi:triacylglycerol lipase [Gordonia sp. TBRC 11910]|uniref:Triacylglycerol lipase n=2 Tax=Gordonia asplenii TaxID=2725283 RepID=A0A848L0J7_9ACTN|nr:triacylglycerol lipase [Gordonia asplenii]
MVRRRTVRIVVALFVTLVMAIGLPAVASAAPSSQTGPQPKVAPALPFPVPPAIPEFDRSFYLPAKAKYRDLKPGQLIAARRVNLATLSVLPLNVDSWQVSYRSTNTRGEAIPAVATVIKPRGKAKRGPSRLLSYQVAEDSTAQYCAPTYQLQLASIPGNLTGSADSTYEGLLINSAVAAGWTVVIPDHEGPDSAFAAGPLHGRITLDGIRAARNFRPLGLSDDVRIGMTGYSGGAIATGHAAELKASYAPELNIVGAAYGGVPADIGALVDLANNNAASGLILAGVIGVSREYPELAAFLNKHMNTLGHALLAGKNPLCLTYQAALAPFLNIKGLIDLPGDPMKYPTPRKVLGQLKMGKVTPEFPISIMQSNPDWIAPVGPVNTLVKTYCRTPGARVAYTRDHFSEHITLAAASFPAAMVWLDDRFNGKPVAKGCSTFDAGSITLNQKNWPAYANLVGDNLAAIVGMQIGNPGRR